MDFFFAFLNFAQNDFSDEFAIFKENSGNGMIFLII